MERLTYQQARDKILEAYFKDEIKLGNNRFCICGTLSPDSQWNNPNIDIGKYPYSFREYKQMESAAFDCFNSYPAIPIITPAVGYPGYEDRMFKAMSAALDVLKEIHRSRGENVDDPAPFVKRQLEKAI